MAELETMWRRVFWIVASCFLAAAIACSSSATSPSNSACTSLVRCCVMLMGADELSCNSIVMANDGPTCATYLSAYTKANECSTETSGSGSGIGSGVGSGASSGFGSGSLTVDGGVLVPSTTDESCDALCSTNGLGCACENGYCGAHYGAMGVTDSELVFTCEAVPPATDGDGGVWKLQGIQCRCTP